MMQSAEIRQLFLDFFKSKGHTIVPSAPIVIKDDPTLLFTNAGMNQFKDYFLGNKKPSYTRAADTQKCLRVSGKHNDLEEVGVDTYHHTMFEMLGNWSFGNSTEIPVPYFKEEAIEWAWELLTDVLKLDKLRLYVTVFEGDEKEGLPGDEEAISFWKKWIPEERILMGKKKDNFWEMGDSGPCGPCTEIHFDSRNEEERNLPAGKAGNIDGKSLVNNDHPQVIEIWNIVFIQFNRKKDGSLEPLPAKHVDTGMGFERLVRVLQNKQSNYDTDIFTGTIAGIEKISNKKYTNTDSKQDVAFRVIADHIRAICFTVADGQMPSNTGAGYVIRRILRRAVRYYFSYLDVKEPLLYKLIPLLAKQFENVFPELFKQKDFVEKVVHEEEQNFLRTLDKGLIRFEMFYSLEGHQKFKEGNKNAFVLPGKVAFELLDTFGIPIDLTRLLAAEKGLPIDEEGFEREMLQQKNRSRAASIIDTEDWIIINENGNSKFVGYDTYETESKVLKYRKTKSQGKETFQIVLDTTPFYAESGGQVGDTGVLIFDEEKIPVVNTKKENDLIIHFAEKLPANIEAIVIAKIDFGRRKKTAVHHSATHLLHAALHQVLGNHVAQKGSLVNDEYLRFDFSHFAKVTDEEIKKIESIVNEKIRLNVPVMIQQLPKEEALKTGAMALFGEKYGDTVRVVTIDPSYSIELCGGTHVGATGELGFFKIIAESAVGAGIRRIEALSGKAAEDYIRKEFNIIQSIRESLKNPNDINKALEKIIDEKNIIQKRLEAIEIVKSNETVEIILKNGWDKHKDFNIISYSFECYSEEIFIRIFNIIRAKIKNSVIILGARISSYERLRIFLNSSNNNYASNSNPLQFKDEISNNMSDLILLQGGPVILDASGKFKSGLKQVVLSITRKIKLNAETVDSLFPDE